MILPDAPVQPVTLNNGFEMPSWYDIEGLSDRFSEDCKGIEASRQRISSLIENEIKAGIAHSEVCRKRIMTAIAATTRWAARLENEELRINRALAERI